MTSELSNLLQTLIQALGWSLVHFVWQGFVIAIVLAMMLLVTRKAKAQWRYAIACAALLSCAALPAWKFLQALERGTSIEVVLQTTAQVSTPTSEAHPLIQVGNIIQTNLHWIVLCWALVVCLLSIRLFLGLWWLQGYGSGQRGQVNRYWQAQLDELAQQFTLPGRVLLRVVKDIDSPLTIGWLRPMVLVPASLVTGMEPSYLQALLAHELAHIRRHDYLINLIQNLIEMILFFHPAVWWISKKIRNERENIADDLAASMLGEPRRLALALQELELLQFTTPQLAQAAHGGNLMSRIKRLIRPEVQSINWKTAVSVFGVATICVGMVAHASVPEPVTSTNAALMFSSVETNVENEVANVDAPSHQSPDQIHSKSNAHDAPKKIEDKNNLPANSKAILTGGRIDFEAPGCRPEYPSAALKNELTGATTLQIESEGNGKISKVHVLKSSGHAVLDDSLVSQLSSGKCLLVKPKTNVALQKSKFRVQYIWKLDAPLLPQKKVEPTVPTPAQANIDNAMAKQVVVDRKAEFDFTQSGCAPNYPRAAIRHNAQGLTAIKVAIDESGLANKVELVKSSGFDLLDSAVIEKIKQGSCRGKPAIVDGKAHASILDVTYLWKLE